MELEELLLGSRATPRVYAATVALKRDRTVARRLRDAKVHDAGLRMRQTAAVAWLVCEPMLPVALGPESRVTIGRDKYCDMVLQHPVVSGHHATISLEFGALCFSDEDSANGSFVNGEAVASCLIGVGDTMSIGPYVMGLASSPVTPQKRCGTKRLCDPTTISFQGHLDDLSICEVLHTVEFFAKTGRLVVEGALGMGELVVRGGVPVHASYGDLEADEAVLSMLHDASGTFSFHRDTPAAPETFMSTTLSWLMFESLRRGDEAA